MYTVIITAEALSILYLLILFFGMLMGDIKHRTNIAFIVCIGISIFGISMDLLSYILEYTSTNSFPLTIVNMFSFFGYDFELMTFAIYVWTIVAEKEEISRRFVRFINISCLADIIFVLIGTITGRLFFIENGKFIAGPWYNLGGVIGFIILVSMLVFTVKKRKTVGSKPFIFTVIFFVINYISIFITLITGIDSYMYVCMSLVMMLVYIILQQGEIELGQIREHIMFEMSTTDVLTKLNNRRAFQNTLDAVAGISQIGVIFCDVNGLKTTNDNLGHAAGDALLLRFSQLLCQHFSSSDIFRISGDEFVILLPNTKEDNFLSQVNDLKRDVYQHQEIASIGHSLGNGSVVTELISTAEKAMYDDKKSYYQRHGLDRRKS